MMVSEAEGIIVHGAALLLETHRTTGSQVALCRRLALPEDWKLFLGEQARTAFGATRVGRFAGEVPCSSR